MIRVPNVDFLSLNFANIPMPEGLSRTYQYSSPKYAVDKVVGATTALGSILPISAPAANSSWILDFAGPSITCTDMQGSALDAVKENIQAVVQIELCMTSFGYIAWTPAQVLVGEKYELYTLSFVIAPNNTSYALQDETLGPLPIDGPLPTPATIYVATFPNMTNEVMG